MFSLLHKALDLLGMELSAQFFMSDFEFGIRDAFLTTFPGIEAKGRFRGNKTIKQELEISHDEAIAAVAGKHPNRFRISKDKKF